MDWRVLLFALVISLATSSGAGLMLAFGAQARRSGGIAGRRRVQIMQQCRATTARIRTSIMAGKVAVACLLLVGASLLVAASSR